MVDYAKLKDDLRDLYRAKGVRRVVYFHCDHWEPWQSRPGEAGISARNADEITRFVDTMGGIDFARRLTLFYKDQINYVFDRSPTSDAGVRADPDDAYRFPPRPDSEARLANGALGYLAKQSALDVQVHIHHEYVTHNLDAKGPEVDAYLASERGRRFEEARFQKMVSLAVESIGQQIGKPLEYWLFVHGHWGLNASDPKVCHLTRELAILRDLGCLGDFTVPSGRPAVNPRLEVPYFVTPLDAPKGYDLQECEPEFAYGNQSAPGRGKFLIWSSVIKHRGASLDYYSPWLRTRLDELETLARDIVDQSFCVDGTLFIKSHAHSMHPNYYADAGPAIFPHAFPPIKALFSVLFEAAAAAGAEVAFLTAPEVYDLMVTTDYTPPGGFALIMPGVAPVVDGCAPAPRGVAVKTAIKALSGASAGGPALAKITVPGEREAQASHGWAEALAQQPKPPVGAGVPMLRDVGVIDAIAKRVVIERIAALGEAGSGAGTYYTERAKGTAFLTEYETKLATYLLASPRVVATHEIGCGFGALPILLAANGLPAVGMDGDQGRIEGSRAILHAVHTALRGERRGLLASCEFIGTAFPDAVTGRDLSQCVALLTNVTVTQTPDERRRLVEALKAYRCVIMDLQRFLVKRSMRGEEDALVAELTDAGFGTPTMLFDLGDSGRYVRFDPLR